MIEHEVAAFILEANLDKLNRERVADMRLCRP